MSTYQTFFQEMRSRLQPMYEADEAIAIAKLFLTSATGFSYTQALTADRPIPPVTAQMITESIEQLAGGRPVQYVLGRTTFCGHSFRCDERALIPRPETEELVQWILEETSGTDGLQILDVGTGTGCIAISLALALPTAQVTALDISPGALALARNNAESLGARMQFRQGDFLSPPETLFPEHRFDIIVSNPPYIPQQEAETMHRNVRDYEPAQALFVPDADALLFYRQLAEAGPSLLTPTGQMYCETHRDFADATADLFRTYGFREVALRNDLFGAPRMVRAAR
ncbi:MAG: peptide chain release factor N(5)-glutamine methyltransferase [Sphingobacteriales bacterium]|nr:MAG: peptide chain release factor N(5)-glutamine methyltransferase [Sphingobacteriales bacterium]